MKQRLFEELKQKPRAELERELEKWYERVHTLAFDLTMGKVKNIREVRDAKKSIAQILTLLNNPKSKTS